MVIFILLISWFTMLKKFWIVLVCIFMISTTSADSLLKSGSKLSAISYNVWFDSDTAPSRYPAILELIADLDSDIGFLQEVTPIFIENYTSSEFKKNYFFYSTPNAKRSYGLAYISKAPLYYTKVFKLPSQYQRTVFFAAMEVSRSDWLLLANVHLESGSGEKAMRGEQVNMINDTLMPDYIAEFRNYHPEANVVGIIFGGDFNIENTEHHVSLEKNWQDAVLKTKDLQRMTYDIKHNPLARSFFHWFQHSSRLDRFYLKSLDKKIEVGSYRVIDSIRGKTNMLSDHYPISINVNLRR